MLITTCQWNGKGNYQSCQSVILLVCPQRSPHVTTTWTCCNMFTWSHICSRGPSPYRDPPAQTPAHQTCSNLFNLGPHCTGSFNMFKLVQLGSQGWQGPPPRHVETCSCGPNCWQAVAGIWLKCLLASLQFFFIWITSRAGELKIALINKFCQF